MKYLLPIVAANIIWGTALAAPISDNPTLNLPNGVAIGNWSYTRTASGICAPADATGIDASVTGGGQLQIAGGFVGASGVCDHLISFDATAPSGMSFIGLTFNGAATGNAFAQIVETVQDANGNVLDQTLVDTDGTLQSYLFFAPQTSIRVFKDILLFGDGAISNHATISMIVQDFATDGEVPEPGTVASAGAGIALLAFGRWRRR